MKFAINSHTVCRGPDGRVKWEADTVPIEVDLEGDDAAHPAAFLARLTGGLSGEIPPLVIDTNQCSGQELLDGGGDHQCGPEPRPGD